MPLFNPYPRRYNSLRLLGYEYNSIFQLCAITLVTNLRFPVFADIKLAKRILACLLNDQTLNYLRVTACTLMPDHLHLIAGIRQAENNLLNLVGRFKSYTTQEYWARSREIAENGQIDIPPTTITESTLAETRQVLSALVDWRATLRPEVVRLSNWPKPHPGYFIKKHLWQPRFFDHVIRNDDDLRHNLDYITMNPVRAGYVARPEFYPYTAFL